MYFFCELFCRPTEKCQIFTFVETAHFASTTNKLLLYAAKHLNERQVWEKVVSLFFASSAEE